MINEISYFQNWVVKRNYIFKQMQFASIKYKMVISILL